jgi:predicted O-methyltransferase YrrM
MSRNGSVIVADNVLRKGAVIDADSRDPNVQMGYDGFTIVRVL